MRETEVDAAVRAYGFSRTIPEGKDVDGIKRVDVKNDTPILRYELKNGRSIEYKVIRAMWIGIAHVGGGDFKKNAEAQIAVIKKHVPTVVVQFDEKNTVYTILDTGMRVVPFLIYKSSLTDIMRSSSPIERIFIRQENRGGGKAYRTYIASSFLLESMTTLTTNFYFNPRPGIDRPQYYEPIPAMLPSQFKLQSGPERSDPLVGAINPLEKADYQDNVERETGGIRSSVISILHHPGGGTWMEYVGFSFPSLRVQGETTL